MSNLRDRIKQEMVSDYKSSLEKNFEIAKQLIRITEQGSVDILDKEKLTGQEMILLYLIGKCYAKEAGLATSQGATNQELKNELGKSEGSIFPWLKALRDSNKIKQNKEVSPVEHFIPLNLIESMLKSLINKQS